MTLCHITGQSCNCTAPTLCRPSNVKASWTWDVDVRLNEGLNYGSMPLNCTYVATDSNYDCDCDQDGFFSTSPTGYGRTPLDAIVDLLDNMEGWVS